MVLYPRQVDSSPDGVRQRLEGLSVPPRHGRFRRFHHRPRPAHPPDHEVSREKSQRGIFQSLPYSILLILFTILGDKGQKSR